MKKYLIAIAVLLFSATWAWAGIEAPVDHWPLTQDWMESSTVVSDVGTGGNHGTLVNAPVVGATYTTFDGVNQNVVAASVFGDVDFKATAFSISMWLNQDCSDGDYSMFVNFGCATGTNFRIIAVINSKTYIKFIFHRADNNTLGRIAIEGLNTFTCGSLHHVVITHNGGAPSTTNTKIYMDNVDVTNTTGVGTFDAYQVNAIKISYGDANGFTGFISDGRIYPHALSADDVAALYALGRNSLPASGGNTVEGVTTSLVQFDDQTAYIDAAGDGGEFLWLPDTDLSQYSSHTPRYKVVVYDVTNDKYLIGYAGAAGGGEALGGDLLAGWNLTVGWTESAAIINDADTFTTLGAGAIYKNANVLSAKELYKISTVGASTASTVNWYAMYYGVGIYLISSGVTGSDYHTGLANYTKLYIKNMSAGVTDITSMTLKRVTDCATTGLHIYDAATGGSRGWASAESGFDYNATNLRVMIYPAGTGNAVSF